MTYSHLGDAFFAQLATVRTLCSLRLRLGGRAAVGEGALTALAAGPAASSLELLSLEATDLLQPIVTSLSVDALRAMPALHSLALISNGTASAFEASAAANLARLPQLRRLRLAFPAIDAHAIAVAVLDLPYGDHEPNFERLSGDGVEERDAVAGGGSGAKGLFAVSISCLQQQAPGIHALLNRRPLSAPAPDETCQRRLFEFLYVVNSGSWHTYPFHKRDVSMLPAARAFVQAHPEFAFDYTVPMASLEF